MGLVSLWCLTCHSQAQRQAPIEEIYLRPRDEELAGQAQLGQADRVAQQQGGQHLGGGEGDHTERIGQSATQTFRGEATLQLS